MNNQEVKVNFYDGDEESWQLTDDDGTVETFLALLLLIWVERAIF